MSSLRMEHRLCTCLLVSRTNQVNEQNVKHVVEQNVSGSTRVVGASSQHSCVRMKARPSVQCTIDIIPDMSESE